MKNSCGICGGGVRLYTGELHGRPITDWKHTDVPPGTAPHRPVLGRPVPEEVVRRLARPVAKADRVAEPVPPPVWAARPAEADEVPRPAATMFDLAQEYGWELEPPWYFRSGHEIDFCVLRARRADLAWVASWKAGKFEEAWVVRGKGAERVGSNLLKQFIKSRQQRCSTCGRTDDDEECEAHGHQDGDGGDL